METLSAGDLHRPASTTMPCIDKLAEPVELCSCRVKLLEDELKKGLETQDNQGGFKFFIDVW